MCQKAGFGACRSREMKKPISVALFTHNPARCPHDYSYEWLVWERMCTLWWWVFKSMFVYVGNGPHADLWWQLVYLTFKCHQQRSELQSHLFRSTKTNNSTDITLLLFRKIFRDPWCLCTIHLSVLKIEPHCWKNPRNHTSNHPIIQYKYCIICTVCYSTTLYHSLYYFVFYSIYTAVYTTPTWHFGWGWLRLDQPGKSGWSNFPDILK